jgi:predicted RecB family nuclease
VPPSLHLSKSRFTSGLQCHKQLWWRVHEPVAPELAPDAATEAILEQGIRVGEVARGYVPGGVLVDLPPREFAKRARLTRELLDRGVPAIYEASFLAGDLYSAVDILERHGGGFALIEVKSTTAVKDEHIPDVAFQLHVLRRAGLEVGRAELMHLNRECVHPHLENLFAREDVRGPAEAMQAGIPGLVAGQQRMLAGPQPDVAIGPHCTRPHTCPFLARCWGRVPEHHVSTLYRVADSGRALVERGIETIDALPPDSNLSAIQERQRRAVVTGRMICEPGLGPALESLHEPLAFLDFETVSPAIPVWPGCRPYDAVPAQFSCHRTDGDGTLRHLEWLPEGSGDPRPDIAEAVIGACRGAAAVIAYNSAFERGCLERLAAAVPGRAAELEAIAGRLADLLPILRDHVYHPAFHGSFSLKQVLPALVPGLGYDDLSIADGEIASLHLSRLVIEDEPRDLFERAALRESLRRYCERDTLATVRLLERLRELAAGPAG